MIQDNDPAVYYRQYQQDKTIKQSSQSSSYLDLFRFADRYDYIMMIIGGILALANGVSLVFYSRPIGLLVDAYAQNDKDKIVSDTLEAVFGFLINSAFVFVISWLSTTIWMVTSERQMITARKCYVQALLRQQAAWHDRNKATQLCSKMYTQISKVHEAIVNNITNLLTKISLGVSGIIVALARGWQMSLVMLAFLPLMVTAAIVQNYFMKQADKFFQKGKIQTDSETMQVFSNIVTVKMMGGEQYQSSRFSKKIGEMKAKGINYGIKAKLAFAVFFFFIFLNYALGFWYGAKLVSQRTINSNSGQPYKASDVLVIFFTLYISNLSLSFVSESVTAFNISRVSMKKIILIVDRQSRVIQGGLEAPSQIQAIIFKDVLFRYDKPLFQKLNLKITPGVTALIGPSGNGKTTIINLILRFYDIFRGEIGMISNGQFFNINGFSFQSLRGKVGYVGQQPVLIGKTIRQAINGENMQENELIQILEKVKAWNFVKNIGLDSEYQSLSGGQKQRIAIARALTHKPEILILDQGTSALDRKTEQDVLKSLSSMRIPFILMIAHRMQTVVNCNRIIKLEKGKIVADGTYVELVSQGVLSQIKASSQMNSSQMNSSQVNNSQLNSKSSSGNFQADSKLAKLQIPFISESSQKKSKESQQPDKKIIFNENENQIKQLTQNPFSMKYIWQLMKINKKSWYLYVFGIIGAIYVGCIFPAFSYILSNIMVLLIDIQNQSDLQALQQKVLHLSIGLFVVSGSALVIVSFKGVSFAVLNEKLGAFLKRKAFRVSVNKPMPQIDEIGPQALAHVISVNCQDLKYLGGSHISDTFQNLTTIVVGLAIAFAFSWQITLVALGIFPIILLAGLIQMSFNHGLTAKTDQIHKKNHEKVLQAILNYKTLKSCNIQEKLLKNYQQSLDQAIYVSFRNGNIIGIMFGLAQSLVSVMLSIVFFIGAIMIRDGISDISHIYTAIYAVMFSGVQAGGNLGFLGKIGAAKTAACNYFSIIEGSQSNRDRSYLQLRQSNLHPLGTSSAMNRQQENIHITQGNIKFSHVNFKYPTRNSLLFNNLNLQIKSGQKVALVGQSGSGKTSIANLLFKIYEIASGKIDIDGKNLNDYQNSTLKRQIGIVCQQPVLFNRSIIENIVYNTTDVTYAQVISVLKKASAYQFIKEGNFGLQKQEDQIYDQVNNPPITILDQEMKNLLKPAGMKGSFLSGGQKQRIAIARALIRKPKIIILDEATSALDNENERFVQKAIQQIKGVTQIIIAHRLSTIENCDKIIAMKQGKVIQEGAYQELLNKQGYFYELVNALQQTEQKSEKTETN